MKDELATAEEAVRTYRRLLPTNPARYGPMLVEALRRFAWRLHADDWHDEALSVGEEIVRIERHVNARRKGRERDLGDALHDVAVYLASVGRLTDALRAADESLTWQHIANADNALTKANRDGILTELSRAGMVVLGPYPLCELCEQGSGGLIATEHRPVHVRAKGREACVDEGIADVVVNLWRAGCDVVGSCQDFNGRAYVNARSGPAEKVLEELGFTVQKENGTLYFSGS